jgi:hypothetical protein
MLKDGRHLSKMEYVESEHTHSPPPRFEHGRYQHLLSTHGCTTCMRVVKVVVRMVLLPLPPPPRPKILLEYYLRMVQVDSECSFIGKGTRTMDDFGCEWTLPQIHNCHHLEYISEHNNSGATEQNTSTFHSYP